MRSYYSASKFEPFFDSNAQREQKVAERCVEFTDEISDLLEPLYRHFDQQLPSSQQIFDLVKEAAALSRQFAVLEAGLVMMDIGPLNTVPVDVFSSWTDVHKSRGTEESEKLGRLGGVAMILYPGLLKIGRDNGSNWGDWSVWNKARVAVFRPEPIVARPTTEDFALPLESSVPQPGKSAQHAQIRQPVHQNAKWD